MKHYPAEFKADAVALYRSRPGATIKSVAADLGVDTETRTWIRAADGRRSGARSAPATTPQPGGDAVGSAWRRSGRGLGGVHAVPASGRPVGGLRSWWGQGGRFLEVPMTTSPVFSSTAPSADGPADPAALRLFVRQPLTRSSPGQRDVVQAVVDLACDPEVAGGPVVLLPYTRAHHAGTFKDAFTEETGLPFSPAAFRDWRLQMLDSAHVMLVVRTELSESGAYEVAYNVHAGPRVPVFFAVHRSCPITTTLLRELTPLVDASYTDFDEACELTGALREFLALCRLSAAGRVR